MVVALLEYFSEGTEKNHGKLSVMLADIPAEI
jgi:hypothetical protein